MKWREPWRESIKQQGARPQLWGRIFRGFLIWYALFAAMVAVYSLVGHIPYGDIPNRLAMTSVFAFGMSAALYAVWFLSPRKIDSGPRGIVVTKANEIMLIPWPAIASFQISRGFLPGSLSLKLHSGEEHTISLPYNAQVAEISREISEMSGAQV